MNIWFILCILFIDVAVSQNFVINTPLNVVECQPTLFTWNGGTPPYFLSILPGNQPSAAALEDLGQQNGNSIIWKTDIAAGTSVGLTLRDSTGAMAESAAFRINPGTTDCLTGSSSQSSISTTSTLQSVSSSTSPDSSSITPSTTSGGAAVSTKNKTPIGGIIGGVVGGLVILAAIVFGLIFRTRSQGAQGTIQRTQGTIQRAQGTVQRGQGTIQRGQGTIRSDSAPEPISGAKPVRDAESHPQTSVAGLHPHVLLPPSMTSAASPSHRLSGGMVASPLSWPDLGNLPSPSNTQMINTAEPQQATPPPVVPLPSSSNYAIPNPGGLTNEQITTVQTLYRLNVPVAEIADVMERMRMEQQASGQDSSIGFDNPPSYTVTDS